LRTAMLLEDGDLASKKVNLLVDAVDFMAGTILPNILKRSPDLVW